MEVFRMLLYHGSPSRVDTPSLSMARGFRDFGRGLYLAEEEIDSLTCCLKGGSPYGFLHTYEVDEESLLALPGSLSFDDTDNEWLRIIFECRMFDRPVSANVIPSVITGPTAGNRVNELFRRYRREGARFEDCMEELRRGIITDKFGFQWCLRSEEATRMLRLVDREQIWRDEEAYF